MAYNPTVWARGDIVSSGRLNHIENGIVEAHNGVAVVNTKIDQKVEQLEAMIGSPLVASTVAEMVDDERVYVYVGNETGYTSGNWYYFDGEAWVSGGVYNSTAFVTDPTLEVEGMAADAKATGDEISQIKEDLSDMNTATSADVGKALKAKTVTDGKVTEWEFGETGSGQGLTTEQKTAILNCFAHVAWTDNQGQTYYDALESALFPPTELVSISAVYNSNPVYDSTALDELRPYLTVTAHNSDGTTNIVTSYALSGNIAIGTQIITVSYSGKTTTFTITVIATPGSDPTAWEDEVAYPNVVIDGEYADVAGDIKHYDGWARSEMLPIYGATKLQFPIYGSTGTNIDRKFCSFYKEDKTWLERFPAIPNDNVGGTINVPSNAYWFVISAETANTTAIMTNGLVPLA